MSEWNALLKMAEAVGSPLVAAIVAFVREESLKRADKNPTQPKGQVTMRKSIKVASGLALLALLGACSSTATTPKAVATPQATSAPTTATSTTPTTAAAPKPTTPPTTAAPGGAAAVQWVDNNPSVVATACKGAADALASGYVTDAQAAKAEVDGLNGANTGVDNTAVMGVIATRCDPKTGAALLAGLLP